MSVLRSRVWLRKNVLLEVGFEDVIAQQCQLENVVQPNRWELKKVLQGC